MRARGRPDRRERSCRAPPRRRGRRAAGRVEGVVNAGHLRAGRGIARSSGRPERPGMLGRRWLLRGPPAGFPGVSCPSGSGRSGPLDIGAASVASASAPAAGGSCRAAGTRRRSRLGAVKVPAQSVDGEPIGGTIRIVSAPGIETQGARSPGAENGGPGRRRRRYRPRPDPIRVALSPAIRSAAGPIDPVGQLPISAARQPSDALGARDPQNPG